MRIFTPMTYGHERFSYTNDTLNLLLMSKNMSNKEVLKATILKKLKRRGKWGGAHTSFDVLARGIPKHLRGDAKEVATELIKDGLLLSKSTS